MKLNKDLYPKRNVGNLPSHQNALYIIPYSCNHIYLMKINKQIHPNDHNPVNTVFITEYFT